MTTLITAIYGDHDELKELPEQSIALRAICITDRPIESETWEVQVLPEPNLHPRLAAKKPKFQPWNYSDSGPWLWLDASAKITSSTFAQDALLCAKGIDLAQFSHPLRDCIYDEAAASDGMPKYEGLPIYEQVEEYRRTGHPENWGLWATGCIAYWRALEAFGARWFQENVRWTYQDQLSEAPLLRRVDMRPGTFPGSVFENDWLTFENHRTNK